MALDQQRFVIILAGILLAVIIASVGVLWLLPAQNPPSPTSSSTPSIDAASFDLRALQRSAYTSLDQRPIQEGALPVQPPANVGKPNPML
jgi:hypothetical protein